MSKTMRAIMCRGPKDYRLEEVPMPHAGPGEVVIKVNACGV
jgi:L-iditol 2-dehydrogenase